MRASVLLLAVGIATSTSLALPFSNEWSKGLLSTFPGRTDPINSAQNDRASKTGDRKAPAPLTGWASRLNIDEDEDDGVPEEDSPILFPSSRVHTQPLLAYASDPFISLSSKAWAWASQRLFGSNAMTGGRKFAQSGPYFAAYGDTWYSSNSLGTPDPSLLDGFTHYNLAFWLTSGPADNALEWSQGTKAQRRAIVKAYNDAGIRLGVSVFGSTDYPQNTYDNATELALVIKSFVKGHSLQGVDVDYEDSDRMQRGETTKWLIPLQRELRNQLPSGDYYITHAPQAPYFNKDAFQLGYDWFHERVGDTVDFYNVQFYNQGDYEDCTSLISESGSDWPGTSLLQLNSQHGVPYEKLVVGKPSAKSEASNGYMAAGTLGKCLKQARNKGWNGGVMLWQFEGGNALKNMISSIKSSAGFQ